MAIVQNKLVLINLHKSYTESTPSKYSYYDDIQSAMNDINDTTTCTLEVLTTLNRKIYLDIENVPDDKPDLINQIVTDFMTFMNINGSYCLTYNKNSAQHEGLSYHVIIPYVMRLGELKQCVIMFKTRYPEYDDYVDELVYSTLRLFRLPNQGKVTGKGIDNDDAHILMKGTLEEAFIQITDGFPLLTGEHLPNGYNEFNTKSEEKMKKKKHKRSGNHTMLQFTDSIMSEFNKLKDTVVSIQSQNEKLLKMNDILFMKIIELEKGKL